MKSLNILEELNEEFIFDYKGVAIPVRKKDGYFNFTAMARATNTRINDYLTLQKTFKFLKALANETNIDVNELTEVRKGGNPILQGTWGHPLLAYHFAFWADEVFALWTTKLIQEYVYANTTYPVNPPTSLTNFPVSETSTPVLHSFPLEQIMMATNIHSSLLSAYKDERSLVAGMSDTEKKVIAETRSNLADITRRYLITLRKDLLPESKDIEVSLAIQTQLKQSYQTVKKSNDMVSVNQRQEELFLTGEIPRQLTYEEISKVGKKASKSYQAKYHHYPSRIKVNYSTGSVGNVNCYTYSDLPEIVDIHIKSIFGILSVLDGNQHNNFSSDERGAYISNERGASVI